MAEAAGGGRRSGALLPEDLVIYEILTRLPAKPVLRCRAVCRSWRRRLTSDAKFLLAHHRRQPSLPLLIEGGSSTEERRLDTLDHRTGERRPVARTTGRTAADEDDLKVLASCDGLLVLAANGSLQICNPATRQRAPLPLLHDAFYISALYSHRPSGSYRVLCCFTRAENGHAVYRVHTVGSSELRCVGEPPAMWASGLMVMAMHVIAMTRQMMMEVHVVADGWIYWPPLKLGKVCKVLAFDTIAESFQQLVSPVNDDGSSLQLFQMNCGALGLYHHHGGTADLWVLQDRGSWSWSMNHRMKLDGLFFSMVPVLNRGGDVLVLSKREGSSSAVLSEHLQHISGANGSLLARYEWSAHLMLTKHRLKESLVQHDFLSMEGNTGGVDEKSLFDGLSTLALVRDDNSEPR